MGTGIFCQSLRYFLNHNDCAGASVRQRKLPHSGDFPTHLPDRLFRLDKLLFDLAAFQRCKPAANADKRQAIFRKLPQMRNRPRSREVILFPIGRTFPCFLRSDMDTVVLLSQGGGKLL